MLKYLVSTATATGDTVKTLIDTIQLPAGARSLVGVWAYGVAGAGLTTLENVTGILELESDDVNIQPCQIPLEPVVVLTSGTTCAPIKTWPIGKAVAGGERVKGYVSMDMALTVAAKARFGLIVDVP